MYTWGHEVEIFRPCDSEKDFWVIGDQSLLLTLRNKSEAQSRVIGLPYQSLYIEAMGIQEGKANDGFAADYDGVYRLVAVKAVSISIPADCGAHG